jgi:hypothetical protein
MEFLLHMRNWKKILKEFGVFILGGPYYVVPKKQTVTF